MRPFIISTSSMPLLLNAVTSRLRIAISSPSSGSAASMMIRRHCSVIAVPYRYSLYEEQFVKGGIRRLSTMNNMQDIQVLIIDPHQLARDGLRLLLVGEAYEVVSATSWQHDIAANAAQEHRSYTTSRDMILPDRIQLCGPWYLGQLQRLWEQPPQSGSLCRRAVVRRQPDREV